MAQTESLRDADLSQATAELTAREAGSTMLRALAVPVGEPLSL